PGLPKSGRDVHETRDLDLQASGAALGMAMEDLDDDHGPIEHLGVRRALEIALLAGRQLVVDDDHGRPARRLDRVLIGCALVVGWRLAGCVSLVLLIGGGLAFPAISELVLAPNDGLHAPAAAGPSSELRELAFADHRSRGEARTTLGHPADDVQPEGLAESI